MSTTDAMAAVQTVLRERQGRDRGWWAQMEEAFWPDSHVRLSWYDGDGPGFVAGSAEMSRRSNLTTHEVASPVVHVRGDRAIVEAPVTIVAAIDVEGIGGDLVCHSRLNYRLERRDGIWGILRLDAIYERANISPRIPGQVISVAPDALAGLRSSYALLAWEIGRHGATMSQDHLGDDRPAEVSAFYAEICSWLGVPVPSSSQRDARA